MPITTKQRAQLRGLAMAEDTIIQIGKGGITDSVIASVSAALKARELVKGKVLETSLLSAREACDAICDSTGADGVQTLGSKFVIFRINEKKRQQEAEKRRAAKAAAQNPVRRGIQSRRARAKQAREQKNEYFRQAAIERSRGDRED